MNQLDDHTRRALCAADQPPPGVEDRILGAILAGPGPGPDGGGSEPSAGSGSGGGSSAAIGQSSLAYALQIVGATVGLAAAGVALLAITAAAVHETKSVPSDARVSIEAPAQLESPATADDDIEPEPAPAPHSEAHDSDPQPAPAPTTIAPGKPTLASKPGGPTLEAELALMKLARESGDPKQALVTLERHRLEFAAGVFAAEREVLRVEQLCALGRRDEASVIAAAFVRKHPDNPLRSRVEPACKTH